MDFKEIGSNKNSKTDANAELITQKRAMDLGQSLRKAKLDAAINASPSSKDFWNKQKNDIREDLKKKIADGGDYKSFVEKKIWPGPLQTQVMEVANILHSCARLGKVALLLPKDKAKVSKALLKGLSEADQASIAKIAAIERAFIKEYQLRKKMRTFDQAWNHLLGDVAFIRMLSLHGKPGFEVAEADLRKKYGLTHDQTEKRKYLADAFRHVAQQARLAGFSKEAIDGARQSLDLPLSSISSPLEEKETLPGFELQRIRATTLRIAKEKAKEEEQRKRKLEEEEKKRFARRATPKKKGES